MEESRKLMATPEWSPADGNIYVDLSLTICEIFGKQIKCQKFYLRMEGQGEKEEEWDLRHLNSNP